MEVEYLACSNAISEVVWIKGFLKSSNIKKMPDKPIKVMCDNQVAICTIKSGELGTRGKHIERHYYYIFDVVLKNEILVEYASSKEMVAYPLTKAAAIESFKDMSVLWELLNNYCTSQIIWPSGRCWIVWPNSPQYGC